MKKMAFSLAAAAFLATPALAVQVNPAPQGARSLTLAALQARVQAQFQRTDANGDGFITPPEAQAQAGAQTSGPDRSVNREQRRAKRAQRLARLDTNKDGTISVAERQARAGQSNAANPQRLAKRAQRKAERQALRATKTLRIGDRRFARIDLDKDGRVSLAEVSARTAKRFQRLDANRDGSVTREERQAFRAQRKARQQG